jgi:VCBS repeat-containing protein
VATTADLDITPINDAPTTTPVTLTSIVEDSGARLITQAELLANANDVDAGDTLTATGLTIATGLGTLIDNLDGTWTYTPALNDDTNVSFIYTITDGSLNTAGVANLDITPVNDAPFIFGVSGANTRFINDTPAADVFTNPTGNLVATDVDDPANTLTWSLTSSSIGAFGNLVVNSNGSYVYVVNNAAVNALASETTGSEVFNVTVTDPQGLSANTAITILIIGEDEFSGPIDPPVDPLPPIEPEVDPLPPVDAPEPETPTDPEIVETPVVQSFNPFQFTPFSLSLPAIQIAENIGNIVITETQNNFASNLADGNVSFVNFNIPNETTYQLNQNLDQVNFDNLQLSGSQVLGIEGGVQTTGVILTAGTVWWALSATGLLASVMTSLPAWRQVDFLAILEDEDENELDDDGSTQNEAGIDEMIGSDNNRANT